MQCYDERCEGLDLQLAVAVAMTQAEEMSTMHVPITHDALLTW